MKKQRAYLAGPLFNKAEKDFNCAVAKILEDAGYDVFLPQRDGFEAALLDGKTQDEKVKLIFDKDTSEIEKADILFMVLDGRVPDDGACVELGIAYRGGKRCYGLKTDTRSLQLDMDLNPLIRGCFKKVFYNTDGDKALAELKTYLEKNAL